MRFDSVEGGDAEVVSVDDDPEVVTRGGPGHRHEGEAGRATCPACWADDARADLDRAQRRLRRLRDELATGLRLAEG